MSKKSKESSDNSPYSKRYRFSRKNTIYTRAHGASVGAAILDTVVMILKIGPQIIDKAISNESKSLFTAGNNTLTIALGVFGIAAAITNKRSSFYSERTAAIEGEIAAHELNQQEVTPESKQPDTEI